VFLPQDEAEHIGKLRVLRVERVADPVTGVLVNA
jgi:hypothetical protein